MPVLIPPWSNMIRGVEQAQLFGPPITRAVTMATCRAPPWRCQRLKQVQRDVEWRAGMGMQEGQPRMGLQLRGKLSPNLRQWSEN